MPLQGTTDELYPCPYLKPDMLAGREVKATILDTRKEMLGGKETPVAYLLGWNQYLILTRWICDDISAALGTKVVSQWNQKDILLYVGTSKTGKPVIRAKTISL